MEACHQFAVSRLLNCLARRDRSSISIIGESMVHLTIPNRGIGSIALAMCPNCSGGHDWTSIDDQHWTRPGKTSGTSATLCEVDGVPIFTVFSTSAGALAQDNRGTNPIEPFALLSHLEFAGDRARAASYVGADSCEVHNERILRR